MKKFVSALLVFGALTTVGCSQSQKTAQELDPSIPMEEVKPEIPVQAAPANMCIPEWELAPPQSTTGVYGSGQAKYSNPSLARAASDASARQAIASILETKTASVVDEFIQESVTVAGANPTKAAEVITKNVSTSVLHGAQIERRHMCPDGTIYSLAFYPFAQYKQDIVESAAQESQLAAPQNKEVYDAFLNKEALQRLDEQIDSAFAQ